MKAVEDLGKYMFIILSEKLNEAFETVGIELPEYTIADFRETSERNGARNCDCTHLLCSTVISSKDSRSGHGHMFRLDAGTWCQKMAKRGRRICDE